MPHITIWQGLGTTIAGIGGGAVLTGSSGLQIGVGVAMFVIGVYLLIAPEKRWWPWSPQPVTITPMTNPPNQSFGGNIFQGPVGSVGQTGGTVNQFNAAPPATMTGVILQTDVPVDDAFQTTYELTIENVSRLDRLTVAASAPSVKAVDLMPARVGAAMMNVTEGHDDKGALFISTTTPTHYMTFTVTTGNAGEQIELAANLEQ